jgi:hypothetical protein
MPIAFHGMSVCASLRHRVAVIAEHDMVGNGLPAVKRNTVGGSTPARTAQNHSSLFRGNLLFMAAASSTLPGRCGRPEPLSRQWRSSAGIRPPRPPPARELAAAGEEPMEKKELVGKAQEALSPFETQQLAAFFKNLTLKSAMENPWLMGFFLIIFFYAVVKRSKPVLAFLFVAISVMVLFRYTLDRAGGEELSVGSTLPFAFGGIVIGGVLIYFIFIKSE